MTRGRNGCLLLTLPRKLCHQCASNIEQLAKQRGRTTTYSPPPVVVLLAHPNPCAYTTKIHPKTEKQVPKKTRLYVEQTQREKGQAEEIHRAFQKDLCRLRLTTARAYVDTITDSRQGVSAIGHGASLRLHALCQGLVRERRGTGGEVGVCVS